MKKADFSRTATTGKFFRIMLMVCLLTLCTGRHAAFAWDFLTESAHGRIKVFYKIDGGEAVFKFVNNGKAGVKIKYHLKCEVKGEREKLWKERETYFGATINVNDKSENHTRLDLQAGSNPQIRKVRGIIINYEYY